ncbi:hypothetical protein OH492_10135 [Vibrio chagasii]|nr:hypothetical protein [Vibrio chagasii]
MAEQAKVDETLQIIGHQYEGYTEHMPQSGTRQMVNGWTYHKQYVVTKTEMEDRGAVRLVDALDGHTAGVNNTGEGWPRPVRYPWFLTHSI